MAYVGPAHIADYENAERRRHPAILREVPSSSHFGHEQLDIVFLTQLLRASDKSVYMELEQAYTALRDHLAALRSIPVGWDGYNSAPPNPSAIAGAEAALTVLRNLNARPSSVLPSSDGGVGICFTGNQRYAHIEFENDGDVWALMYGPDEDPETWKLESAAQESIREAWNRIRASV